jgi:hypothetical protein
MRNGGRLNFIGIEIVSSMQCFADFPHPIVRRGIIFAAIICFDLSCGTKKGMPYAKRTTIDRWSRAGRIGRSAICGAGGRDSANN